MLITEIKYTQMLQKRLLFANISKFYIFFLMHSKKFKKKNTLFYDLRGVFLILKLLVEGRVSSNYKIFKLKKITLLSKKCALL